MPGWPTVDRAADQELAEALRRADSAAPAALCDSYAERLHDYAYSLSRASDLAADSVHDALVTAQGCAARLRDPAQLRPWLYALTRFQVRARLARRSAPSGEAHGPAHTLPLPELGEHDDAELAAVIRDVLGELSGSRREVLELSLRHGLTPSEVGAVLGLTSRQSATRLGLARDHLENAAAAVLLARTGRAHCPALSALLDSWEGPLTPPLRQRLSGHISGCEVCTEGRHRRVSARRLLDMVPITYPPGSLRRRVIDTCLRPDLDQTRVMITDRGDDLDRSGFPVPADHRRRRPRRLAPLLLAGACLMAATGAMVVINDVGASDTTAQRPVPSVRQTRATEEPAPVIEEEPEPSGTPSPSRTPSARATPATPPAAAPRRSRRPAAVPAPTRRRPVTVARLRVSCPQAVTDVGSIGLSARGAAVSWTASASERLEVHPASGSIRAGGARTVRVTVVDPELPGSGRVALTSNGGAATCSLSWPGDDLPEPPTDGPAPSEEPSGSPTTGVGPSADPEPASGQAKRTPTHSRSLK